MALSWRLIDCLIGLSGDHLVVKLQRNGLYVVDSNKSFRLPAGPSQFDRLKSLLPALFTFKDEVINLHDKLKTIKSDPRESFGEKFNRNKKKRDNKPSLDWVRPTIWDSKCSEPQVTSPSVIFSPPNSS